MSNTGCVACQKTKANYECGLCQASVCKSCAQFVPEDQFSFLPQVPAALSHSVYCPYCFDQSVAAELESYNQLVEKAKSVMIFHKSDSKLTRFIKRTEDWIEVKDRADESDILMQLAFFAAQAGFNAVVDVQTSSKKVSSGKYQSSLWSGRGTPAHVDPDRLVKDRSIWQNPN